jgi:hypothetical protein
MRREVFLVVVLGGLLAACVPVTAPVPQPAPQREPVVTTPGVYAGFDTWQYPGEAVMRSWRETSPYRWVGYYLTSPCHRHTTWMGTRGTLERMGWGIALLYVGQQFWERPARTDLPPEQILCSNTLLTAERGRIEGRDAVAKATLEGFPSGSIIFLNVERMQQIPEAFVIYYQAWQDEVLASGRYRPGTYVHRINAADLYPLAQTAYLRAGSRESPPFWVAGGQGFTLDRAPSASGYPFAQVWQGVLDVQRTFGGVTLYIDENTASRPNPSAP